MEALLTICECDPQEKVKLATHTFKKEALHWWESIIQAQGREATNQIPWERFLEMFTRQFFPTSERRRIEAEFLRLELGNRAYREYVTKFNEMARFVPHLVTPEDNRIHRFIWGLPVEYRTLIKSTNPQTCYEAIEAGYSIAVELDREKVENNKRKREEYKKPENQNRTQRLNPKRGNFKREPNQCLKCGKRHFGICAIGNVCYRCRRPGHVISECPEPPRACYECGSTDHLRNTCPKLKNKPAENKPKGRAFHMTTEEAKQADDVITGTFLLNELLTTVLFDSGANKSFISYKFCHALSNPLKKLEQSFTLEIANGKHIEISDAIDDCFLNLEGKIFPIRMMATMLGEFDLVIGMD
ncbi:uncharacterized protein LOC143633938 [Bidens hawaiensis]|uniref:uncharacterized protein LOC143633938 n=1 Tax=Bidens hawaiensis TaxID=980011 RepID=UPI00404A86EC